jgi:hypothetical protein
MNRTLPRNTRFLLAVFCLTAPIIACSVYLGGPAAPGPEILPSGTAQDIESAWENAIAVSGDGSVVVIFEEAQLTAYLQEKLAANPTNSLHSAQVFLRDGRVKVYGMLESGSFSASVLISLRPDITPEGGLNLVVEQAQLGPLDLPGEILSGVSSLLTGAFTGQVGSYATGFMIQEILVGDGKIAMRGVLR